MKSGHNDYKEVKEFGCYQEEKRSQGDFHIRSVTRDLLRRQPWRHSTQMRIVNFILVLPQRKG